MSTAAADVEPDTSWMDDAACRGLDVNVFFPDQGDVAGARYAKQICAGCSVRLECLEWALVQPDYKEAGILGGTSAHERRDIRTMRRARARVARTRKAIAECGTDSGYYRHHRFGEPACDACTAAHAHKERLRYHLVTT